MLDLRIFPGLDSLTPVELQQQGLEFNSTTLALGAHTSGDIVVMSAGAQSCAQQVLLTLLTEKGAIPTTPNAGSNLISLLKHGYNPSTIDEDIVLILIDVEEQCKSNDIAASRNIDAQLAQIELLSLTQSSAGQLGLTIGIKTVSGATASLDVNV
jgi:hypothetical protein